MSNFEDNILKIKELDLTKEMFAVLKSSLQLSVEFHKIDLISKFNSTKEKISIIEDPIQKSKAELLLLPIKGFLEINLEMTERSKDDIINKLDFLYEALDDLKLIK